MGGSGAIGGGGSIFASVIGTSGHSLHTNGEPINPPRGYHYQNGRSFCEAITVNWQLRDVLPGLGGFACVPGSACYCVRHWSIASSVVDSLTISRRSRVAGHKANYRCPRGIQMVDHDPQHQIKQLVMSAGSVSTCTPGTDPFQLPFGQIMPWSFCMVLSALVDARA